MYKVIFARMKKLSKKGTSWKPIRDKQTRLTGVYMYVYIEIHARRLIHVPGSCLVHSCCDSILPSSSRRHKQKTLTWWKYKPCAKATWVPADLIPTGVKQKLIEGLAPPRKLQHVMMSKRVVVGPSRAHEQLRTKNHITSLFSTGNDGQPRPWQLTPYTDNAGSENPHKRCRIDPDLRSDKTINPDPHSDKTIDPDPRSDKTGGDPVLLDVTAHMLATSPSGNMNDPQQLLDATARIQPMTEPAATDTNERDHTVPDGTESKITAMMETINRSYDSLPAGQSYMYVFIHPFILTLTAPSHSLSDPSKKDFETAYHDLCQQQYFTGKLAKMCC